MPTIPKGVLSNYHIYYLVWARFIPNGKTEAGNSKSARISMNPMLVDIPEWKSINGQIYPHKISGRTCRNESKCIETWNSPVLDQIIWPKCSICKCAEGEKTSIILSLTAQVFRPGHSGIKTPKKSHFWNILGPKKVSQIFWHPSSPYPRLASHILYVPPIPQQIQISVDQPYPGPAASCCVISGTHSILHFLAKLDGARRG
jgi:hypothetical protein